MSRFTLSKPILTEAVVLPAVVPNRAIPDEDDNSPRQQIHAAETHDESDSESDSESNPEVEPVPVVSTVYSVAPVVRKIRNEEAFWNYIEKMSWRDRSEDPNFSVAQKKLNYRSLAIPDQEAFADYLTHVVNTMDEKLQAANCYGTVTDADERKAICSHIVGRGSIFYAMTMEDPGFASYLVPENPDRKEYYDMMELIRI
jgi:hypothetical protein